MNTEKPETEIAKHLLNQIERENSKCAFWMVSAINKIANENPEMTIGELKTIVHLNMPDALEQYAKYVQNT